MIYLMLAVFGLILGSFANAVVWRLHEQAKSKKNKPSLSISRGRSMCVHCRHVLGVWDLIPVVSWLMLKGKCRYCGKTISWQYPAVELLTAVVFVISYQFWPFEWDSKGMVLFGFWLLFLLGFVILSVYDLRWYLLPDKVVFPLVLLAVIQLGFLAVTTDAAAEPLVSAFWGVIILSGLFYLLFIFSNGRWIGGGDVKLGFLLGLIVGGPREALLVLFIASLLGTAVALPLLAAKRVKRSSHLPFGPFLILAAIIVYLFGASMIGWYESQVLLY